jgi:hypothetical protein
MKEVIKVYVPIPNDDQKERYKEIKSEVSKAKDNGFKVFFNDKRLFVATNTSVCYFTKKSRKWGYQLSSSDIEKGGELYIEKPKESSPDQKKFNSILKYRKKAYLSTFTNDFIEKCRSLPETFDKWVEEGKKGLYEYSITTGNGIDGKIISLTSVAKASSFHVNMFKSAIKGNYNHTSSRFPFRGYEATLEYNAEFKKGWLSVEFKDCGNGYYYLLINDNEFIGYDVD